MYPFWKTVVEPILRAPRARADRGDRRAPGRDDGADARRPRPRRRAARHRPGARSSIPPSTSARFPGRYVFHRDLSLNVLADAPAVRRRAHRRRPQLVHGLQRAPAAARGRRAGRADRCRCSSCTTWAGPTAAATSTTTRRRSPRSSASPTRSAGMRPGPQASCSRGGGLNRHARTTRSSEGGPRNGVHDRARRLHGRARPAAPPGRAPDLLRPGDRRRGGAPGSTAPELAARLDELESAEGKDRLLELSESIRLDGAVSASTTSCGCATSGWHAVPTTATSSC